MLEEKYEEALVDFLALVYMRIPWGRMHTSKNPYDIFNHRVRASARRSTIYEFASKLCNYFGLQSLPLEAQELLDLLRTNESKVLHVLSTEHIPYCVRAILKVKEVREKKRAEKKVKDKNEDKASLFEISQGGVYEDK